MIWSATLMTSRLCSMTITVLPASTSLLQNVDQLVDIRHMQARRRLVEDIERAARIAPGQLRRQLDALASPPESVVAGLAELDIAKAHVLSVLQFLRMLRECWRKTRRLLRPSCPARRRCSCPCISLPASRGCSACPRRPRRGRRHRAESSSRSSARRRPALLAAAALDVEGEAPRLEPAHLRVGRHLEQLADVGKDVGIGRRIAARRAADRRLVDHDDLVECSIPSTES